jgi:hypothetical protein
MMQPGECRKPLRAMKHWRRLGLCSALCGAAVVAAASPNVAVLGDSAARAQIAATTLADAVVVDCQLPGRLQQLGGMRTYLSPGVLTRLSAIDCRTRGGEYTVGDLGSGTLSLQRWLPLAQQGSLEAQYYVARIYANGMGDVPVDYAQAAAWYQRAADKKYPAAMQELGYLYEQGLGVKQDQLRALNLQREASGLGEDLDYAWKLGAAKEEAARQISALTDQLDAANAAQEELRSQLVQAGEKLRSSRAELLQAQDGVLSLRARLAASQRDGTADSAARIKVLQEQLAEREGEVADRQQTILVLNSALTAQQIKSQAATSQLNELLASGQNENLALRARLAQSEQRYLQSQQELSALRGEYREQANALAARSAELERIRAHGSDVGAAVLAEKQRQLEQTQLQVKALEDELASQRQVSASATAADADVAARNRALQAKYSAQQQQLQSVRAELAQLQAQSNDARTAVVRQMSEQLAAGAAALEGKQRQIASLQQQTDQLRTALSGERAQRERDGAAANDEIERGRSEMRMAQAKISQQREQLEQLQTEASSAQLKLVQERDNLAQQQLAGQQASAQQIAQSNARVLELEAQLRDKSAQVSAAQAHITELEQQLGASKAPPLVAGNVNYRLPQDSEQAAGSPDSLLARVRGMGPAHYHALVIGNSNYRLMPALDTPTSDARAVAEVLRNRYGFDDIKLLLDATTDQIMQAMNGYAISLTDADRLLVYYAGHGGTKFGPPERAFWLGVDADPALPSSWLSAQVISDTVAQIRARHVLLVADSCFSSAITHPASTTVARTVSERRAQIEWSRAARMVLTSGQNEPVADTSLGAPRHSLFAEQFITVLRQNDILMSGEMLAAEISSRMTEQATRLGIKQTPTYSNLQDPNHKYGDFFFVPVASPMQVASLTP